MHDETEDMAFKPVVLVPTECPENENEVYFHSTAMGVQLRRGEDGFVRVVSVTEATIGSSIIRDGMIVPEDKIMEAAGVNLRSPITNQQWGETVARIKNARRPMKFVVAVGPKRRSPETATNNINASSRRLRRVRAFQGARGYDDDVHHLQQNKPIDEAAAPTLECIASPHLLSNSAGWEKEQDEDEDEDESCSGEEGKQDAHGYDTTEKPQELKPSQSHFKLRPILPLLISPHKTKAAKDNPVEESKLLGLLEEALIISDEDQGFAPSLVMSDTSSHSEISLPPLTLTGMFEDDNSHNCKSVNTSFRSSPIPTESGINSTSAIYSQDEDKMYEQCKKTMFGNVILNDGFRSDDSELTVDAATYDINYSLDEHGDIRRDCNYGTLLDDEYEDFGIERQLVRLEKRKLFARMLPRTKLPAPLSNPVDVDEASISVVTKISRMAKEAAGKGDCESSVEDFVQMGNLNWLVDCGEMDCGDEDDVRTSRGTINDEQLNDSLGGTDKISCHIRTNMGRIIDVVDYAINGKTCENYYYDDDLLDTVVDGDLLDTVNEDSRQGNDGRASAVNTDAIRMQKIVFVSPNVDDPSSTIELLA